jgi:RNA polymerase sigma factor (sigma-70 family)
MELTDKEIKLARQGSMSAWKSGRNLIESDDLFNDACLWMLEHPNKILEWRDEGKHGENKLRNAARQRCLTIIRVERQKRAGFDRNDVFYYTQQMIREIIPNIFDVQDWTTGETVYGGEVRGSTRPNEGNNRLAMIADVRSAFYSLPEKDRVFLENHYRNGGLTLEEMAAWLDCSDRTVRRRDERIMDKLVERLGGEPPWAWHDWHG